MMLSFLSAAVALVIVHVALGGGASPWVTIPLALCISVPLMLLLTDGRIDE